MRRERGMAMVEAVVALPACVLAALVLVDCGVVLRDRVAVTHAATRGASALLAGEEVEVVALGALPAGRRDGAEIEVDAERVVVRATSRPPLLGRVGGIDVASEAAAAPDEEVAR